MRAEAAVFPSQAVEHWTAAALSDELLPRPLDVAVEVACFWGERLLEVRCVNEGQRLETDGPTVALRKERATIEGPGSARVRAGATALVDRAGTLTLTRGEKAVLTDGPLAWGVRFVRAPRALPPEPMAPSEVRFFKYAVMGLLAVNAAIALALIAGESLERGAALLSPRMVRSVVQSAARALPPKDATTSAPKLNAPKAPPTPASPKRNEPPARGAPGDKRAAVKAMMASLFGQPSAANVFAPDGLGQTVNNSLAGLQGDRPALVAEGAAGLGLRGTGSGGGDRVQGIVGLGTVGRAPGLASDGFLLGGERHRGVRVGSGPTTVVGGLDKDVIRGVIHRHESEVKFCYESALSRRASLSGKVMVSFLIGPTGDVAGAGVGESTLGDDGFEACLLERVRTWRFPPPAGGGEVQVNYPWVVRVAGEEQE